MSEDKCCNYDVYDKMSISELEKYGGAVELMPNGKAKIHKPNCVRNLPKPKIHKLDDILQEEGKDENWEQKYAKEHETRIKYQDIVYQICNLLDDYNWINSPKGVTRTFCTIDTVVKKLKERLRA